jgi:hypothetical protein
VLEIRGERVVHVPEEATRNDDLAITALLIVALSPSSAAACGSGSPCRAWPGSALQLFSARPAGDAMAVTIWGSASSWTLTALPCSSDGRRSSFARACRRTCSAASRRGCRSCRAAAAHQRGRLRDLRGGVGSSAATCATIGKMSLPELARAATPTAMAIGSLAGAGTLGLLIPPSIIMIVYGVTADVSIAQLFIAGVLPGHPAGGDLLGLHRAVGAAQPAQIPPPTRR